MSRHFKQISSPYSTPAELGIRILQERNQEEIQGFFKTAIIGSLFRSEKELLPILLDILSLLRTDEPTHQIINNWMETEPGRGYNWSESDAKVLAGLVEDNKMEIFMALQRWAHR